MWLDIISFVQGITKLAVKTKADLQKRGSMEPMEPTDIKLSQSQSLVKLIAIMSTTVP